MTTTLEWHWGISNAGPDELTLWLEPWADAIMLPNRSTAILRVEDTTNTTAQPDVEDTGEHIVIWANAGQRIHIHVDGLLQETTSSTFPVPDGLGKNMLHVLFSGFPEARLGGQPGAPTRMSIWQRIKRAMRR